MCIVAITGLTQLDAENCCVPALWWAHCPLFTWEDREAEKAKKCKTPYFMVKESKTSVRDKVLSEIEYVLILIIQIIMQNCPAIFGFVSICFK